MDYELYDVARGVHEGTQRSVRGVSTIIFVETRLDGFVERTVVKGVGEVIQLCPWLRDEDIENVARAFCKLCRPEEQKPYNAKQHAALYPFI